MEDASVQNDDEVVVLPGTYENQTDPLVIDDAILVRGRDNQPRPVIPTTATPGVSVIVTGAVLRRVQVESTVAGQVATGVANGGVLERVHSQNTADGGIACSFGSGGAPGMLIRDSVCRATGSSGDGIRYLGGGAVTETATARNVTIVSSGGGFGVQVNALTDADLTLDAKNIIASGGTLDVFATTDGQPSTSATVTLTNSNYDTEGEGPGGSVTNPGAGTNQTAAPLFVNPAAGDFHQVAGSPTIDAGTGGPSLGALDIDGDSRFVGSAPDIGADEFVPPPPSGPPPTPTPVPLAPSPSPGFDLAAAIRKCKKKFPKGSRARKKCIGKARARA